MTVPANPKPQWQAPGSSSGRPKGYHPWRPTGKTAVTMEAVYAVLDEYRSFWPLTLRQVFYRLVGAHGYDKTDLGYQRLSNYITRARRAQLISFDAIRDDGLVRRGGKGWDSADAMLDHIYRMPESYLADRTYKQPGRVELWCESRGMLPQLHAVADPYDITVYSTGGFNSVTVHHEAAKRIVAARKPTTILHVGDFDPSGESIFTVILQDIGRFVAQMGGEQLDVVRVAITPEQVVEHNVPTAPSKKTDTRTIGFEGRHGSDATAQAEALPPDLLNRIVTEAITDRIDDDVYREVLMWEEHEHARLTALVQGKLAGTTTLPVGLRSTPLIADEYDDEPREWGDEVRE